MKEKSLEKVLRIAIPLIIAVLSFFIVSKYVTAPEFHAETIAYLEEKRNDVMELTAASTVASTVVSTLPNDIGTPVANKLADLSGYFLIALCALFLEKYLLTISGYVAFKWLIPVACIIFSGNAVLNKATLKSVASKLVVFSLAIFMVVPTSVEISKIIESTHKASIEDALEGVKDIPTENNETQTKEEVNNPEEDGTEEKGLLAKVFAYIGQGAEKITTAAKESVENVVTGSEKLLNYAENVLSNFIEALAVILVTSCIIPVVVLLFFVWIIKIVLESNFSIRK